MLIVRSLLSSRLSFSLSKYDPNPRASTAVARVNFILMFFLFLSLQEESVFKISQRLIEQTTTKKVCLAAPARPHQVVMDAAACPSTPHPPLRRSPSKP
jgi:hypothetical protein